MLDRMAAQDGRLGVVERTRNDLPSAVRAVETMTASLMVRSNPLELGVALFGEGSARLDESGLR